jgi:hypothetical protein
MYVKQYSEQSSPKKKHEGAKRKFCNFARVVDWWTFGLHAAFLKCLSDAKLEHWAKSFIRRFISKAYIFLTMFWNSLPHHIKNASMNTELNPYNPEFWNISETPQWTNYPQRNNEAGERNCRTFPHATRHELHIVVLRRSCIRECLSNTMVNKVASQKNLSRWANKS